MYEQKDVELGRLLFDPNNFRFQDKDDWVLADPTRFGEESVQSKAYQRLKPEGVAELKRSILTNGFLPIERLVVRRFDGDGVETRYLVLEGNRRLAALKSISEDHDAGVPVSQEVLESLDAVPVVLVAQDDDSLYKSVMGIRHVGGIKQWDGYQRAKLVTELRDQHGLSSSEVADRLGMTVNEVNRRYRAYKALDQMTADEEYQHLARPRMYPIFHEAVSVPQVRDWLGWEEAQNRFTKFEELHRFYDLIVGEQIEEDERSEQRPPKITSYSQVRELKSILLHTEALASLLDPEQGWGDALGLAKADDLNKSWRRQVAEATTAIRAIGAVLLSDMNSSELDGIRELLEAATKILDLHEKLHS